MSCLIEFCTKRLVLRPPEASDAEPIAEAVRSSLPELSRWLSWARPDPDGDEATAWIHHVLADRHLRRKLPFVIVENGVPCGAISASSLRWEVPSCEVGCWLRTDRTGRGLAAEALTGLRDTLARSLGLLRVELVCDENNHRSRALAERCGFVLEGTRRCDSRTPEGSLRNSRLCAWLAESADRGPKPDG